MRMIPRPLLSGRDAKLRSVITGRMVKTGGICLVALVLVAACDRPDAEKIRGKMHLPPPGFVADPNQGARLFASNCARCHGQDARGTDRGPPLIHKTYLPRHHGDLVFHMAVKKGARQHHWHFGDMPPVAGLSPEAVGHIIAYVRREQRRSGIR